uniref:Uncharacterized protein n=1 Tax=Arundo donax TaxID=35708 RepID=A0A0A8ZH70_ARUDO
MCHYICLHNPCHSDVLSLLYLLAIFGSGFDQSILA